MSIEKCPVLGCAANVLSTDLELHLRHHRETEAARAGARVGDTAREASIAQASDAKIRDEIERGASEVVACPVGHCKAHTRASDLALHLKSHVERGAAQGDAWRVIQCNNCRMRRAQRADSGPWFTIRIGCVGTEECSHSWRTVLTATSERPAPSTAPTATVQRGEGKAETARDNGSRPRFCVGCGARLDQMLLEGCPLCKSVDGDPNISARRARKLLHEHLAHPYCPSCQRDFWALLRGIPITRAKPGLLVEIEKRCSLGLPPGKARRALTLLYRKRPDIAARVRETLGRVEYDRDVEDTATEEIDVQGILKRIVEEGKEVCP